MSLVKMVCLLIVIFLTSCTNSAEKTHEKLILETIDMHHQSKLGNNIELKSFDSLDILKKARSKNWTGSETRYYYAGIIKNATGKALGSEIDSSPGPNNGKVIYAVGDIVKGLWVTFRVQVTEKDGQVTEVIADDIDCLPLSWSKSSDMKSKIIESLKSKPAFFENK